MADSHNAAYIQWSSDATDTIVMVTRDTDITPISFSNFYVSHDYGKTFMKHNDLLTYKSITTSIEDFYQSPVDTTRVGHMTCNLSK